MSAPTSPARSAHAAPAPTAPAPAPAPGLLPPAPLGLVLAVTSLNSVATGVTYNGLAFITSKAYGYGTLPNSLLALVMGVTYVAGALLAGPGLRAAQARWSSLTPRRALSIIIAAAAVLNLLPVAAWFLTDPAHRAATAWAMWVYIALYSALCGSLWPVVESFLSGGRSGHKLRRDMGVWNITWSGSLVVSLVSIGALAALFSGGPAAAAPDADTLSAPASAATDGNGYVLALALGSLLHLAAIPAAAALPPRPPPHAHEHAHPVPPIYHPLLAAHRLLLPAAYVVMYALAPLLPDLMGSAIRRAGLDAALAAPLAAAWLLARVATFFALGRWHGWHGTWFTAWAGTLALLGGFALCVLADTIALAAVPDSDWAPLTLQLVGLFIFGCGAAAIYCGALYYVLEVQSAEVDAGGSHEALIGVGYSVGPLCALIPAWAVSAGSLSASQERPATLGLVAGVTALAVGGAIFGALRSRPRTDRYPPSTRPGSP